MIEQIVDGMLLGLSPQPVLAAIVGLVFGVIVGAIPGLTASITIAILFPFTFFVPPATGLGFLLGIYKGAVYGGSIPAILLNTPGTPAAAATVLDGHAMFKRGEGRKALHLALYASVAGDLLATLVLVAVAAPLAAVAVTFSAPEYTILFFAALALIATVGGGDPVKGLLAALMGALIGCIGLDSMTSLQRFVFDVPQLMGGIPLVPLIIGLFALGEVLSQIAAGPQPTLKAIKADGGPPVSRAELRAVTPGAVRASGIGIGIGALPGLGAEIACWIAYGVAKRRSKRPETFGKGAHEGVVAAEAGNNATVPATLIPMLVFGIPGDVVTAILLGAFIAQGITPGPLLFGSHGEIIYALFTLLVLTNVALIFVGLVAIRGLSSVIGVPRGVLLPCVVVICFAGAYSVNSDPFDVVVMVAGGVLGFAMRKYGFPLPPLIIAALLAPPLEASIRQALMLSGGDFSIFVTRPISGGLLLLCVVTVAWMTVRWMKTRRAAGPSANSPI